MEDDGRLCRAFLSASACMAACALACITTAASSHLIATVAWVHVIYGHATISGLEPDPVLCCTLPCCTQKWCALHEIAECSPP